MTRVVTAAEMINRLFARYRSLEDRPEIKKERKEKCIQWGGKSWKLYEIPERLARYVFPRNIRLIYRLFEINKISFENIIPLYKHKISLSSKYFLILKILIDKASVRKLRFIIYHRKHGFVIENCKFFIDSQRIWQMGKRPPQRFRWNFSRSFCINCMNFVDTALNFLLRGGRHKAWTWKEKKVRSDNFDHQNEKLHDQEMTRAVIESFLHLMASNLVIRIHILHTKNWIIK